MWHKIESGHWTSPDGRLRVEHFIGEWEATTEVGRWAVLTDARTGAVLLDLSAIHDSRVEPAADGGVLVWIDQGRSTALFRIDPAQASFRNLARDEEDARPLEELDGAVKAELRAMRQAIYAERAFSADGSIRVDFTIETWRMSHETRSPRVVETATGKVLLDLAADWDAHILWQEAGSFLMHLRRYTKQGYLTVAVDPPSGLYRIAQEGDLPRPIADMQGELERAFDRCGMAAEEAVPLDPPQRQWRNLAFAIGGGIGLLAAISLVAWLASPRDGHGTAEPLAARPSLFAER